MKHWLFVDCIISSLEESMSMSLYIHTVYLYDVRTLYNVDGRSCCDIIRLIYHTYLPMLLEVSQVTDHFDYIVILLQLLQLMDALNPIFSSSDTCLVHTMAMF